MRFLIALILLLSLAGCARTYNVTIYQNSLPAKCFEQNADGSYRLIPCDTVPMESDLKVLKSTAGNLVYISVTADVPHTVTPTTDLHIPITPLP